MMGSSVEALGRLLKYSMALLRNLSIWAFGCPQATWNQSPENGPAATVPFIDRSMYEFRREVPEQEARQSGKVSLGRNLKGI